MSELKAHLSKDLRAASRGARIVVKDRDEPIAQLGPPESTAISWRDRLAGEGRLRRRAPILPDRHRRGRDFRFGPEFSKSVSGFAKLADEGTK